MIKLRSKKLFKRSSKASSSGGGGGDIQWELRPGGMLVQKRAGFREEPRDVITVRISTVSSWHELCIGATATFGELKVVVAAVTGLRPREQRLLFRGKEREDGDRLHMVGVGDKDKVVLLEDPATKESKIKARRGDRPMSSPCLAIVEV